MASGGRNRDAKYILSKLSQMDMVAEYQSESNPTTLDEAFSLARAMEARFTGLQLLELLRSNLTTLGEASSEPVQDLEETIRHNPNKVEAVKTSMVATSEEHEHQENQDNQNEISKEKDDAKPPISADTFGSSAGNDSKTSGPTTPTKEVKSSRNWKELDNESEDMKVERDVEREGEPTILATFGSDRSIDDIKSILTQPGLDALCEKFHIPPTVHSELPDRNSRIRNSPTGKIGVYTRKDPHPTPGEFDANVCEYLIDNPAPFRKLPEPFLCFVGIIRYYDLDENCYPTFWANDDEEMDLFAFFYHADPTKVRIGEREVGEGEVMLLQLTRGRVVPLAGVNDHEQERKCHCCQRCSIGGIDIMADDEAQAIVAGKPKKVRKKRKAADGAGGSGLPPKKLKEDHGASRDVGASTAGKYIDALQGLLDSSLLSMEVGVTVAATVPFVTSSMTLTPEREGGGHTKYVTWPNLYDEVTSVIRSSMPPPSVLTTVVATTIIVDATSAPTPRACTEPVPHSIFRDSASLSEANQDVAGPSHPAGTKLSADLLFVSQDVDLETLRQTYIPKWNVTSDSNLDDPDICRGVIDHLAPLVLFSQLRSMDYEQLFIEFNVEAARQTCLSSEVRLQLKHELRGWKRRLRSQRQSVFAIKLPLLRPKEVARASEMKGLKDRNAALEGQDLSNLKLSCDELSIKASSLEFEKDKLVDQVSKLKGTCSELCDEVSGYKLFKEQIKAVRDVQVKVLSDRVAELDANLMGMALYLDEEFYHQYLAALGGAIGCAIDKGMQGELAVDIDHGKAGRCLTDDAAYDPSAEANYIFAVSALRAVKFPLLAQLESHKDVNIGEIMGLLHLEGPAAEALEASQLQPSPEQLMLPIQCLEDQVRLKGNDASQQLSIYATLVPLIEPLSAENLVGEGSTFGVPVTATTTALSTTFIHASIVPQVSAVDHKASGAGPSTEVPSSSKIMRRRRLRLRQSMVADIPSSRKELSVIVPELVRSLA
ncbi:hypothetical protein Tco_0648467 [Tanacetum coccineum]